MKKRKVLVSIILMLSLVLSVVPVQNVYAAHNSTSDTVTSNTYLASGTSTSEQNAINVTGELSDEDIKEIDDVATQLGNVTGISLDEKLNTYQSVVDNKQDKADKEALTNISSGTTASGYKIYMGLSGDVSANMSELQLRTAFEQAAAVKGTEIGLYHTNGSKYKFSSSVSSETFNKLMGLSDSGSLDVYKQVWAAFGLDVTTLENYLAPLVRGGSGPVPVIYAVPCFGTSEGVKDLFDLGISPLRMTNDITEVSAQINSIIGTKMLELMTGETASSIEAGLVINRIKQDSVTGHYYLSKWAGPLDISPVTAEPGITAWASPKYQLTDWTSNGGKVVGEYNVKVTLGDTETYIPSGKIEIKIKADFASGTGPQPVLTGTPNSLPTVSGKWTASGLSTSSGITVNLGTNECTFVIPSSEAANWNANSTLTFHVDVTGGANEAGEQSRPVVFSATVNGTQAPYVANDIDTEWKAYGNGGTTYTSWYGLPNITTTTDDKAYAWHSKETPYGESLIVANDVADQDWDVGTGIPSTENISVKTGASAGMVDIYGYVCVRNNKGASQPGNQSNMGEDQLGIVQTNQAVTREVKITAKVTNCWGGGNKPDQLTPNRVGASGGVSAGGSCPGSQTNYGEECTGCHSDTSNHPYWTWSCSGWAAWNCSQHPSVGWYEHAATEHGPGSVSCGSPTHPDTDEFGNVTGHHEESSRKGCTGPWSRYHDCSWDWWVQDAVTGDHWLGQSGFPDSGSATAQFVPGCDVALSGDTAAYGKLFGGHVGEDCGVGFMVSISWKPSKDRQFYEVYYQVSRIGTYTSKARGQLVYGTQYDQPDYYDVPRTLITSGDTVLSQDYTHGTGSQVELNENMVNQGTHTYTITYNETIDAYVYRTITYNQIDSLIGLNMNYIHTISRDAMTSVSGIEYEAGTFNAPLGTTANTEGVSAPSAVGYLWRCCGTNNGEYKSGNGRIEFTAFKKNNFDMECSSNVALEINTEYFLGDANIEITAVQDNQWGKSISGQTSWKPTASTDGKTNRGHEETRYSPRGQSTVDYYVTSVPQSGKGLYEDIETGDCTGSSSSSDNEQNHADLVQKELTAIMNYWCGQNNGLAEGGEPLLYGANIISDTVCYGGTTLTNNILDDAYAVDGKNPDKDGVTLFNIHAEPEPAELTPGGTNNTGEIEAYRNHKSSDAWGGTDGETLMMNLYKGVMSNASVNMGEDLEMFGGVNSNGLGGTVSLDEALASKLRSGDIGSLTNGNGVHGTNGSAATSAVYSRKIDKGAHPLSDTSGITAIIVELSPGGTSSETFSGYWDDHLYQAKTPSVTTVKINDSGANGGGGFNNHGDRCIQEYSTLAISNIPLVEWTPNGMWNTAQIESKYVQNELVSGSGLPRDTDTWLEPKRDEIRQHHQDITTGAANAPAGVGGTDYLNEICIYDPVSSEFDSVLGAQLGKWENGITDETALDQRINEDGTYVQQSEVNKYVVQSQYLWSWLSPIGDFESVGGDGGTGANYGVNTDGAVLRGSGRYGYVPKMNVDTWVETATIMYPFVAGLNSSSYTSVANMEVQIYKMNMIAHTPTTNGQNKLAGTAGSNNHLTDGTYSSYVGKPENVYFGNGFAMSDTSNLFERKNSTVTIYTYAKNCYLRSSDDKTSGVASPGYSAQDLKNTNKHANVAKKEDTVDLVGSIGNLAIHDVTDFRFSNYFKAAVDPKTYLIDGVIYEVDETKPLKIVSTVKDICNVIVNKNGYKLDGSSGYGHAILGTDLYSFDEPYFGMGGKYDELPLVPRYNTVPEYKAEAMRLGYKVYASIDTIGNYQSYIYDGVKLPDESDTADEREYYLDINSTYYLYDFDTGLLYDVDLWSGASGNKERLYDGTNHQTHLITKSGSIYQEVDEDASRRNISIYEQIQSILYARDTIDGEETYTEPTYYLADSHFIGTPGRIRLDNRDISYNGSSNNMSLDRHWTSVGNLNVDYTNTGQRYHFTDGLTSTTVITAPVGDDVTQLNIVSAANDLQKKHPHAVLVEFQTYTAYGTVWTIKYKGSQFHTTSFDVYDTTDNKYIPEDFDIEKVKLHNTITYIKPGNVGQDVYDPDTGVKSSTIDPDAVPLVVMEAYHSAAEDRTVSGTH